MVDAVPNLSSWGLHRAALWKSSRPTRPLLKIRKKQRGRPFETGMNGNPSGRPKGSRNKTSVAVECCFRGKAEAITPSDCPVGLYKSPRREDLEMAVIICVAGAVVGLIVGMVSGWLVLPMVLRSSEARKNPRSACLSWQC